MPLTLPLLRPNPLGSCSWRIGRWCGWVYRLENELRTYLNDSAWSSAGDFSKRGRVPYVVAHGGPAAGKPRGRGIWIELRVVKRVEGFEPQLEAQPLCKHKVLQDPDVPVVDTWHGDDVTPAIPECVWSRLAKR